MNAAQALSLPRRQLLAYGALGLPLAMAALPVYVHVPRLYADAAGMSLGLLSGLLLAARLVDAVIDPTHRAVTLRLAPAMPVATEPPGLGAARAALAVARADGSSSDERRAAVLAAMTATGAPQAVLLRSATSAEIWRRAADGVGLAKQATVPIAASRIVAALAATPTEPAPLLDDKSAPALGRKNSTTRWWVYASLAGAIAISTTVLLVAGGGGDVQRIEVRGP